MIEIITSYIHFLAIMTLAAALALEAMLLASHAGRNTVEDLGRADISYFIAAGLALLSGATKLALSSKGLMFTVGNPAFLIKLALFFGVAGLSLIPTSRYNRWRLRAHMDPAYHIPAAEARSTLRLVLLELAMIAVIPLLAVMMARGTGI